LERLVLPFLVRFAVEREIALELHDRSRRAEQIRASADVGLLRRRDVEVHGRGIEDRRRHLRCHEALPDQLIELELVGAKIALDELRPPRRIRGTHAFVRVLRVLLATAVELRTSGEKLLAEQRAQILACLSSGQLRYTRGVRTHVRDEADRALIANFYTLVEVLRHAHRALG